MHLGMCQHDIIDIFPVATHHPTVACRMPAIYHEESAAGLFGTEAFKLTSRRYLFVRPLISNEEKFLLS